MKCNKMVEEKGNKKQSEAIVERSSGRNSEIDFISVSNRNIVFPFGISWGESNHVSEQYK